MHLSKLLLVMLLCLWTSCSQGVDPWRFLVVADWHGAEPFVEKPIVKGKAVPARHQEKIKTFKHIHDNYGGELVVLPGDAESGKWHEEQFLDILKVDTPREAVLEAGNRCYQSMKYVFEQAGYSKLLMAVGDHEIGGNPWQKRALKTTLVGNFRQVFYRNFNRDSQGKFLYGDPIGNVASRPLRTKYARTSYAYRHKNVLFVTVDAFRHYSGNYHVKKKGQGGEGSVTCSVTGKHLAWFQKVLKEARKDRTIKHIIVQAHQPILQPVRKTRCSGQFFDGAEQSPFFQAMRDYNVDVYFAGEVHANTVTKDTKSDVLQVISRGNAAQNFLVVDVMDDELKLTQYNEIGRKPRHNDKYEFYGEVTIDKSGRKTTFDSKGSLKLLKRDQPMIYFPFDEMTTIANRPVLAMTHDDWTTTRVQRKITVLGVECFDSFPNMGAYGQMYDAQVANVALQNGIRGRAARLDGDSRVAVFSLGPHSGGVKVSYALWIKTADSNRNQLLLHFGSVFYVYARYRNIVFSLTLDRGVPVLYASSGRNQMKLVPSNEFINLANNEWHHIAISMPRNSCRLSEVQMHINGQRISTRVEGPDDYLFITIAGALSIGGFGYSNSEIKKQLLPRHEPYVGLVDEVYVWADSLSPEQVATLSQRSGVNPGVGPTMRPTRRPRSKPTARPTVSPTPPPTPPPPRPSDGPFTIHSNYLCQGDVFTPFNLDPDKCERKCRRADSCLAYDVSPSLLGSYNCRIFQGDPRQREVSTTLQASPQECTRTCFQLDSCLGYVVQSIDVGSYLCFIYHVKPPERGLWNAFSVCGVKK